MKKIHLMGSLGEKYGTDPIKLDASTAQLIISGLSSIFGDSFKNTIRNGEWNIVYDDKELSEELVAMPMAADDVYITPVIAGAAGIGKVIAGGILIVVGVWLQQPWLIQAGVGLAMGGIAQMLAPSPMTDEFSSAKDKPSFLFTGDVVNVTRQGGPVPVGYGEWLCSTVVISAGINSEEI